LKKQKITSRYEFKNGRGTKIGTIVVLNIIALIGIIYYLIIQSSNHEPEIESYIRSQITQKDVAPGFEPAFIYFKRPNMTNEMFCCVGTIFSDKNSVIQIATAEHVFRTDIHSSQILSVRTLRQKMNPPVAYINRIIATGKELGGPDHDERDIVVASLGSEPVVLKPYSGFLYNEIGQNFWGNVVIGKTKITRLRSLLSGEYVNTLGYVQSRQGTNISNFVLIEKHVRQGESGTGYVDDFGGLWVVHSGTEDKNEEAEICKEGKRITGRRITGVATVSGPLFGHYK